MYSVYNAHSIIVFVLYLYLCITCITEFVMYFYFVTILFVKILISSSTYNKMLLHACGTVNYIILWYDILLLHCRMFHKTKLIFIRHSY